MTASSASHASRSLPSEGEASVSIRELGSHGEREACVRLQRRIWGPDYADVVPASILRVAQEVGGLAAGAFVRETEAIGFVFGMSGIHEGRPSHWSHMLGVLGSHRGRGIGKRLKFFQRKQVAGRGIDEIRWTFDPLVAGNAHFNLNLLGVEVQEYVPDMYGDTGSGLHSFGTDRFVARWDLAAALEAEERDPGDRMDWSGAPLLNGGSSEGGWASLRTSVLPARPEAVRLAIPNDILAVNRADPWEAREWRERTRTAFLAAYEEGYHVAAFSRSTDEGRCHYLLRQSPLPAEGA